MRVPVSLSEAFGASFEQLITEFSVKEGLLPDAESLGSQRFLARSVIPHILKLSDLFNRVERAKAADADSGLSPYWGESSNPANLRLAYFLYFMPCNLFRVASVWAELARLGYRWPEGRSLHALELGAGPATAACGISAGERHAPLGLPPGAQIALIEQDRAILELGERWARAYLDTNAHSAWDIRTFRRRLTFGEALLPRNAPKFNLMLSSFFLNESTEPVAQVADRLVELWDRHLDEEGLVILVEPALKVQSRRLLELRKALIERIERGKLRFPLQVLLPCLGHQTCGALAAEDDWCHEEVTWWRPPYFRRIDQMASLDRKTLPFSYLVLARSARPREELLPALAGSAPETRERLVSPAHKEGQDAEFFVCGQSGKRRARYRPDPAILGDEPIGRGDILLGASVRGDVHAGRVERITRRI